jgi:hypothetical protein
MKRFLKPLVRVSIIELGGRLPDRMSGKRIVRRLSHLISAAMAACSFGAPAHAGTLLLMGVGGVSDGFAPSCSQSSAYISVATGISSYPAYESAMDSFICGMVTDGTFALIDHAYNFAAPSQALATVDLVQGRSGSLAAATPTISGTMIFDPNVGFTGDGSTAYIDSGVNLATLAEASGANFAPSSAGVGICVLSSRLSTYAGTNAPTQVAGNYYEFGAEYPSSSPTYYTYLITNNTATQGVAMINSGTIGGTGTTTTSQGFWWVGRTAASGTGSNEVYLNGSSLGFGNSGTSAAPPSEDIFIGAWNAGGTAAKFSADTLGFWVIGGGLSAANVSAVQTRLNTLFTALLMPGTC